MDDKLYWHTSNEYKVKLLFDSDSDYKIMWTKWITFYKRKQNQNKKVVIHIDTIFRNIVFDIRSEIVNEEIWALGMRDRKEPNGQWEQAQSPNRKRKVFFSFVFFRATWIQFDT